MRAQRRLGIGRIAPEPFLEPFEGVPRSGESSCNRALARGKHRFATKRRASRVGQSALRQRTSPGGRFHLAGGGPLDPAPHPLAGTFLSASATVSCPSALLKTRRLAGLVHPDHGSSSIPVP